MAHPCVKVLLILTAVSLVPYLHRVSSLSSGLPVDLIRGVFPEAACTAFDVCTSKTNNSGAVQCSCHEMKINWPPAKHDQNEFYAQEHKRSMDSWCKQKRSYDSYRGVFHEHLRKNQTGFNTRNSPCTGGCCARCIVDHKAGFD